MHPTKRKILDKSIELFNIQGIANVTLRMIAQELNISQGNLNYHFKRKEDILTNLYFEFFAFSESNAYNNQDFELHHFIEEYLNGMKKVFAYRFILLDLEQLFMEVPSIKIHFQQVNQFRDQLYLSAFQKGIENGIFISTNEKDALAWVEIIRFFGDHWIKQGLRSGCQTETETIQHHWSYFSVWLKGICTPDKQSEIENYHFPFEKP